jgi:acyl-CoA thioester hydrolase
MFSTEVQIRVRYAETDQMGYVYYGNYGMYYEVARVESFRKLGYAYKALEDEGVMMPVLELKTRYLKPAKYDDLLTIRVSIPDFPAARIKYLYEIFNEAGEKLNEGETSLVFVDMNSSRPVRIPEKMASLLRPYYE